MPENAAPNVLPPCLPLFTMSNNPGTAAVTGDKSGVDAIDLLSGEHGKVARRLQTTDWTRHPLGPPERWPQSLRTMVHVMLASRFQMWLGWGPELFFFYNDAYAPTLGLKEPRAFGTSCRELWPEIWDDLQPRIEAVLKSGKATWDEALPLILERNGYEEETYHTFSYSPIPDDQGAVGGLFCTVTEVTERVMGERRMSFLRELATALSTVRWEREVFDAVERCVRERAQDLPFALLYWFDPAGREARLVRAVGITCPSGFAPEVLALGDEANPIWPARALFASGGAHVVTPLTGELASPPVGPWAKPAREAAIVPLAQQGQANPAGFLVVGINPYRPYDAAYRGFLDLLAGQITAGISSVRAYEAERQRAEALAEIDRAKTTFFSNVSHELRTPLTLMLGPLEEIANRTQNDEGTPRELALMAHRNGLRLLKLVNTLLDFSRLEAGRMQATFRAVDVASLTADVASTFRSAIEKAGLRFAVDCPPLSEPAYVDPGLWEKVVLNLLSNAFKFTFAGEIRVAVREEERCIRFSITDTGTGIPEHAQRRLFERFYRVAGAQGRTQEGTGIGLAFVQDLVKLHGGTAQVESAVGRGSTFTVLLPRGRAHLPADQLAGAGASTASMASARPYAQEAARWNDDDVLPPADPRSPSERGEGLSRSITGPGTPRILLVDDNADMRSYVKRLLAEFFDVTVAVDGQAALEALAQGLPDLVLSDVMMPRLDGFGLINAIRANPAWQSLPVILLSARAGEEARTEGIGRGADDYLIKPFSARELMARVTTHLELARVRKEAQASVRDADDRLRLAVEAAEIGTWSWDVVRDYVEWSETTCRIFGVEHQPGERGVGGFVDSIHPDDRARVAADVRRTLDAGASYQVQYRILRPGGEVRWISSRGKVSRNEAGEAVRFFGALIDITERQQREQALLDTRARLNATLDEAAVGTWTWDIAANQLLGDASVFRLFSAPEPEQEFAPLDELLPMIHGDDLPRVEEALAAVARGDATAFEQDYRVRLPNGDYKWIASRGKMRRDTPPGQPTMSGVLMDITGRKVTEETLRLREELISTIISRSPVGIYMVDAKFRLQHVNPAARPVFGAIADLIGRDFAEILRILWPGDAANEIIGRFRHTLATGESYYAPAFTESRADLNQREFYDWSIHRLPLPSGGYGVVCYFVDISPHVQLQVKLREAADRLEVALSAAQLGLWSWKSDTDLVDLTPRAAEIFGVAPGPTMTWTAMQRLLDPNDAIRARDAVVSAVERRQDYDVEYRVNRAGGDQCWVAANGRPVYGPDGAISGMVGVAQDITARKRGEEERAALLVQERQAREEAEALGETARALTADLDLHATVQKATDAATKLTGANFGAFFYNLVNERQESYVLYTLSGAPREAFEKFGLPRNTAVFAPTFRGDGVVRLDDVMADPRYGKNAPHHGMPKGHLPVRSYLAVPVISRQGEVLGGMFFGHPDVGVFTARAERIAVGIAAQASIAIDNAKLYQRVQRSADRLNFSLSALQLGDWSWDAATDAISFSPRTAEIYGLPVDSRITREQMRGALHPEDRDAARAAAIRAVETASDYDIEYRVPHPKLGVRWVAAKGRPLLDATGKMTGMMGVVQDITDRKLAELHLHTQKSVLEQIVSGAELSEILEALTQWVEKFSERRLFSTILLMEPDGRHLRSAAGRSVPPTWARHVDGVEIGPNVGSCGTAAFRREQVVVTDIANDPLWVLFKDEALRHGLRACWSSPILSSDGATLGTFAIYYPQPSTPTRHEIEVVDVITRTAAIAIERKRSEDALRESRAELEQHAAGLERTVTERTAKLRETIGELEAFSYSISHDMRAPLRSMQGYAELMLKDYAPKLDEVGAQYLQRISKNAERLELLVRDVLAYSKVAKEDVTLSVVELDNFVPWLVSQMSELQRPDVAIRVNRPLPAVLGHEAYLSQIFTNLIGNAIKFGIPGTSPHIEINAASEGGVARISVRDNGIGIDPQHFNRIFEIFGRVYPDKKFEGTGIGLSIVKKAVQRMGGTIGVDSALGKGTTFWFTLRLA